MTTITIAAEKGGCGKTLLAVTIAAAAQQAGIERILLIDGDSREETFEWAEARQASGLGREIDVLKYSHELSAEAQELNIAEVAKNYDLVIIDTAATHSTFSNDALIASDIVLTPFVVNEKDCRQKSVARALQIHKVLNEHFGHIKTKIVLTRVSTLNQYQQIARVRQLIKSEGGEVLQAFLTDLNPFWKDWDQGLSCFESTLKSAERAQAEAEALAKEVILSCMQ